MWFNVKFPEFDNCTVIMSENAFFFPRKRYTIVFRDQDACYLEFALKWFCRNNIYTQIDTESTHTHAYSYKIRQNLHW